MVPFSNTSSQQLDACKSYRYHANLVTPLGSEVLSKHITHIHKEAIPPRVRHPKDCCLKDLALRSALESSPSFFIK